MQGFKDRPFYTRVALVGVGMYLFLAAMIAVPILIFQPDDILFAVVIAVIALVVGALIYLVRPWGLIAAVLGGIFGVLFSLDGIDLALSSPQSFFDFTFPLFTLPGALLLLVGGIAGLIQHFRKQTSTSGSPVVTMAIKGMLGVIAVLCLVSAVLTIANLGGVSAAEKEGATVLKARHTKFEQTTLTASSSGTKFLLENEDVIMHTFTIDELGIDVKMGPRQEKIYEMEPVPSGEYEYYCRVVGHEESMRGTLTVR